MIIKKKRIKASELELKETIVAVKRVTKVVKGGRNFRFTAVVVVGDGNGVVGYGLGKAKEVPQAVQKGIDDARKNLIRIPIHQGTLSHDVEGKYKGGLVLLKRASSGTGIIAGAGIRAVMERAGIQDVLTKSKGSSSPHNVVKATFEALHKLRTPHMVAAQRGISLEKVFHG